MKKSEKTSLLRSLKESFSPPGAALYAGSYLHISDRGSLQVENCRGILDYDDSAVLLQLDRCKAKITGDGLFLRFLDKNDAEVVGLVLRVDLFYGD